MTITQPGRTHGTGEPHHARRGTPAQYLLLFAAASAAILTTVALVLWYPIDQAAIEEADNAGWNTGLLLPHQFLLTVVLLGACLCSWLTAFASVVNLISRTSRS